MRIRDSLLVVLSVSLLTATPATAQKDKKAEAKAAKEAAKIMAAQYKKQGFKKVKGVWVGKDHEKDAKKGIYHHDGDRLNKFEILKVQSGYVRHPVTKGFILASDLDKAKAGQFPIGGGKWVAKAEADKFHADNANPWVVRSQHCTIISTLPIDTITFQITSQADTAVSRLQTLFGGAHAPTTRRPTIMVLPNLDAYQKFGDDHGGHASTHGAFLAEGLFVENAGSKLRMAAANWVKNWGPYYVRHAAALAYVHSVCGDEMTEQLPEWFHRGLAGYVELFVDDANIKHFGKQHKAKGGATDVAKWLEGYAIRSDMPERGRGDLYYNIFGAGLLFHFGMRGGNKPVTDALQKISKAFGDAKPKRVSAAVKAFGKAAGKAESDMQAYLDKLLK